MKFPRFLLFAMLLASSVALFQGTEASSGSSNREICWSEPPDFDGGWLHSEVIDEFGLESETANDLLIGFETGIVRARWWGEYSGYVPGDPLVEEFNLRFYADGDCLPAELLDEYILPHDCGQLQVGHGYAGPIYEYEAGEADGVCRPVGEDERIWFSAQAGDHPFPPQWGRTVSFELIGCEAAFRSVYFSWPDWTPVRDIYGQPNDASQEFECGDCGGVAVEAASWGRIRQLYR